jgi:hypothetical protein
MLTHSHTHTLTHSHNHTLTHSHTKIPLILLTGPEVFETWGLGSTVSDLTFGVSTGGLIIQSLGLRVEGFGAQWFGSVLRFCRSSLPCTMCNRIEGLSVLGQVLGLSVQSLGYRFSGFGITVIQTLL